MIPDHIASAINSERITHKSFANVAKAISVGDIRRVGSGALERLALVLKVNPETNTTQFTLVHSYVEFATEHDIIVESAVTNLPYSLVVETDLRAAVSTAELGALVAIVPQRIVVACFEGSSNFIEDESMFIGPSLLGPLDARWDFKAEEGEVIRELSSTVVDSVVNESDFGQIKFDHLLRTLLPHSENPTEMALQTYELWISGDVQFTIEHLELFAERDLLTSRIWEDALGVAGEQFFKTVIVPAHEKLIAGSTRSLLGRGLLELQYS
jgi:hypothetical protein